MDGSAAASAARYGTQELNDSNTGAETGATRRSGRAKRPREKDMLAEEDASAPSGAAWHLGSRSQSFADGGGRYGNAGPRHSLPHDSDVMDASLLSAVSSTGHSGEDEEAAGAYADHNGNMHGDGAAMGYAAEAGDYGGHTTRRGAKPRARGRASRTSSFSGAGARQPSRSLTAASQETADGRDGMDGSMMDGSAEDAAYAYGHADGMATAYAVPWHGDAGSAGVGMGVLPTTTVGRGAKPIVDLGILIPANSFPETAPSEASWHAVTAAYAAEQQYGRSVPNQSTPPRNASGTAGGAQTLLFSPQSMVQLASQYARTHATAEVIDFPRSRQNSVDVPAATAAPHSLTAAEGLFEPSLSQLSAISAVSPIGAQSSDNLNASGTLGGGPGQYAALDNDAIAHLAQDLARGVYLDAHPSAPASSATGLPAKMLHALKPHHRLDQPTMMDGGASGIVSEQDERAVLSTLLQHLLACLASVDSVEGQDIDGGILAAAYEDEEDGDDRSVSGSILSAQRPPSVFTGPVAPSILTRTSRSMLAHDTSDALHAAIAAASAPAKAQLSAAAADPAAAKRIREIQLTFVTKLQAAQRDASAAEAGVEAAHANGTISAAVLAARRKEIRIRTSAIVAQLESTVRMQMSRLMASIPAAAADSAATGSAAASATSAAAAEQRFETALRAQIAALRASAGALQPIPAAADVGMSDAADTGHLPGAATVRVAQPSGGSVQVAVSLPRAPMLTTDPIGSPRTNKTVVSSGGLFTPPPAAAHRVGSGQDGATAGVAAHAASEGASALTPGTAQAAFQIAVSRFVMEEAMAGTTEPAASAMRSASTSLSGDLADGSLTRVSVARPEAGAAGFLPGSPPLRQIRSSSVIIGRR